jgi:hypothetical protein
MGFWALDQNVFQSITSTKNFITLSENRQPLDVLERSCYTICMTDKKKKKQPRDLNKLASSIVKSTTEDEPTKEEPSDKNPAAVALGRLGGLKGGKARAEKLSAKKRKEIASKAARARWDKTTR